jgi:hypothetical protein
MWGVSRPVCRRSRRVRRALLATATSAGQAERGCCSAADRGTVTVTADQFLNVGRAEVGTLGPDLNEQFVDPGVVTPQRGFGTPRRFHLGHKLVNHVHALIFDDRGSRPQVTRQVTIPRNKRCHDHVA